MMNRPEVHVHADLEALSRALADRFVELAGQKIAQIGRFSVALSGGSTPQRLYQILGMTDYARQIDWQKVQLFQVDERSVPPEHPSSNFKMVREALIDAANVPPENVHRIIGELPPLEAAQRYEAELKGSFPARPPEFPRFDLVFLGMGKDGHTASLFPGSQNLEETSRWAVPTEPGPEGLQRVTLTLPALNAAALIIFLVTGAEKSETLARVMESPAVRGALPVQRVAPTSGELVWHLDRAAASGLKRPESA